jgi:hypothetical protein
MNRYIGRERRFNCWLMILALAISGRIVRIKAKWNGIAFPHLVGVTPHGRLVHFRRTRGRERRFFSLWFVGRVQVCRDLGVTS